MGVPKFFRYISERYPCLSEVVREHQIPEFDNLYLDMNGIIHVCSHPNDFDPHFRITEQDIFKDIFHYIETLFRLIQPKELFFMAVDGVAPRAKMNQQRGRRFRSAKDAEVLEKRAKDAGETLPSAERFDSNCITPGTVFMARLQAQLRYFVSFKISTDKLWQKPTIILSGHETPGEGEHKIMDYIRFLKSNPDYNPNTRHCLYGLDADLIMLGLCTHEPHFSLLREEVKFGKKNQHKRASVPEEIKFYLLHLSLMREYLEIEFQQLKSVLPFPFNLEKIIDDWVLMGFLVGNDFIPNLPNLHIANGALPVLYKAYIDVLPKLGGYINEGGSLHLGRFQTYMQKLGMYDISQFRETYADLRYLQMKTGRQRPFDKEGNNLHGGGCVTDTTSKPVKNPELAALIEATAKMFASDGEEDELEKYFSSDAESDEDDALMYAEFNQHKNDYYINKLQYDKVTPEVLRAQAECYVRAIQWNLNYYYNGCCSWSWFYPHHYAPFISDITNFKDLELTFEEGQPFLPFQQLLAVLPAASKKLLPEPFQELMTNDDSPIIDFYPVDFKTDMNGKKQEWEAVVLIPFINQDSLLKAMATKYERLTDEEKRRNSHGPMCVFNYTPDNQGVCEAPEYFPTLNKCFAKETPVYREDINVERSLLVKGLCPGVSLDVYFPGFPTLKYLDFDATIRKAKVKVFDQPSRGENTILTLKENTKLSGNLITVASNILGKSVFVSWPHMIEAKVVAVATDKQRMLLRTGADGSTVIATEDFTNDKRDQWNLAKNYIRSTYFQRMGVEITEIEVLVYATILEGQKHVFTSAGRVSYEKQFAKFPSPFALETIVHDINYAQPEFTDHMTIDELFKPGITCFTLGNPHYGAMGTVCEGGKNGRVKLSVIVTAEPCLDIANNAASHCRSSYMTGSIIAQRLGISSHLLSRITGSIFAVDCNPQAMSENFQKVNIGLNLKFNKKNEEVSGYTKKENGQWLYSTKAEQLINDYLRAAPQVISYVAANVFNDVFNINEIFPENGSEELKKLSSWLNEHEYMKSERLACGSEILEESVVNVIEKTIDSTKNKTVKTVTMQIKPHLLLLPKAGISGVLPDDSAVHKLFDRIVCIRESFSVPLGFKGTITGIQNAEKEGDRIYDIVFDKEFPGGVQIRCSKNRGYRMNSKSFINLSHGIRMELNKSKNNTIVKQTEPFSIEANNQWLNRKGSAFSTFNNSNSFNNNKTSGPNSYRQNQQPAQRQKEQLLDNFYPKFSTNNDLVHEEKQIQSKNDIQPSPSKPTSEFQAMWNELKNAGTKVNNQNQTSEVEETPPSNSEASDVLKKMLKIAETSPKRKLTTNTQSLKEDQKSHELQQPHEHKGKDVCHVQLLENRLKKCDVKGVSYFCSKELRANQTNFIVRVQFHYPPDKLLTYVGVPSTDIDLATETAALSAMSFLKLEDQGNVFNSGGRASLPSAGPGLLGQSPSGLPMGLPYKSNLNSNRQQGDYQTALNCQRTSGGKGDYSRSRPTNSFNWFNPNLPTPPSQWYQQLSDNGTWKPMPDKGPVTPNQSYAPNNHQQYYMGGFPQVPPYHYGQHQSQMPHQNSNWRQTRPIVPLMSNNIAAVNPFVPLQAITQCRTRPSMCSTFISKNIHQHSTQESVKLDNSNAPINAYAPSQSRPPSVMSQPRKSRIAAKFNVQID